VSMMIKAFAEKNVRCKSKNENRQNDPALNRGAGRSSNRQRRLKAGEKEHLTAAYASMQTSANEDAERMGKDGLRNSVEGDEVIAQTPFYAPWLTRGIREDAMKISSTCAYSLQRKGPYLNNFDEDVKKWLDKPYNTDIKYLVESYRKCSTDVFDQNYILKDLRIKFYKNQDGNLYSNCGAIAHKFLEALLDESDFVIREQTIIELKMESKDW
jgi:hypothetical protein